MTSIMMTTVMTRAPGQMKTAEGMVEFSAPQVRDTPEPFVSAIRENLAGRTQALEDLELYARGLSTRDIEDAFTDEIGRRLLSRAAVSEITERLWAEYEAFTKRDLSEYRIVYLYVDGIAGRPRAGQPREAVIARLGHQRGRPQCSAPPHGRAAAWLTNALDFRISRARRGQQQLPHISLPVAPSHCDHMKHKSSQRARKVHGWRAMRARLCSCLAAA